MDWTSITVALIGATAAVLGVAIPTWRKQDRVQAENAADHARGREAIEANTAAMTALRGDVLDVRADVRDMKADLRDDIKPRLTRLEAKG